MEEEKVVVESEKTEQIEGGTQAVDEVTTHQEQEVSEVDFETKQPQGKKLNSEFAKARREKEQAEKLDQMRVDTTIKILKGINPFTNKPMKDKRDVEEYERMVEIESNGGDPLSEYNDFLKEQERKQEVANKKINDDIADFEERSGLKFDDIQNDDDFKVFAEGKLGGEKSLFSVYSDYQNFKKVIQDKANKKTAQAVANGKTSVGSLEGDGNTQPEFFTKEYVQKMAKEDKDFVHKNFDAIRKSMEKW